MRKHAGRMLSGLTHHRIGITIFTMAAALLACGELSAQRGTMVGTRYVVNVDGETVMPKSVEGGVVTGLVAESPAADGPWYGKKNIAGSRQEDIVLEVGLDMGKGLAEWIKSSWAGTGARKNGSIITTDFNWKAQSEREFLNAAITATTFPALDASSKEAGSITLTITPEQTRAKPATGDVRGVTMNKMSAKWLLMNFKFEMDGLPTGRVSRIDSFTVRQPLAAEAIGAAREPTKHTGRIEFPNLKITLSEADAKQWVDWHDDFVVKGNNDDTKEKGGAIVLLGPDLRAELLRIPLRNCGIVRVSPEKAASTEAIRRVTAEIYCERMEFAPAAGLAHRDAATTPHPVEGL